MFLKRKLNRIIIKSGGHIFSICICIYIYIIYMYMYKIYWSKITRKSHITLFTKFYSGAMCILRKRKIKYFGHPNPRKNWRDPICFERIYRKLPMENLIWKSSGNYCTTTTIVEHREVDQSYSQSSGLVRNVRIFKGIL